MNFGINENNSNEAKEKNLKIIPIIIIVVVAILAFIIVFLITNSIFNKPKPTSKTNTDTVEKISITDDNVRILYKYVTTGTNNIRVDKFVKNKKVDKSSFTDEEKLYFALQFAEVSDFEKVEVRDNVDESVYTISIDKIKKYITRFFGSGVKMEEYVDISYPFSFSINGKSLGKLTYSEDNNGYDAVFSEIKEEEDKLVEEFYTKLDSAYKKKDGSYYLVEKVIYTSLEEIEGKYKLSIYKDFEKENLIEEKTVTKEELENDPIKINEYIKDASTITYVFKPNLLSQNSLYFDSSSIN